jgi:hypothetical protein
MDKVISALSALVFDTQLSTIDQLVTYLETKTKIDISMKTFIDEFKGTLSGGGTVGEKKKRPQSKDKIATEVLSKEKEEVNLVESAKVDEVVMKSTFTGGRGGFGGKRGGFGAARGRFGGRGR